MDDRDRAGESALEQLGLRPSIEPGSPVDVRDRFEGRWAHGFEVAEVGEDGSYRVRRLSDGSVLPGSFERDSVRRERRRNSTWWY